MRILLILSLGLGLSFANPAFAENLCVDPDDSDCFATIADAVAAAVAGDRISIANGIYNENVVVNTEDLEIRGGKRVTVDPDDPLMGPAFVFNGADFVLSGFRIRNGAANGVEVSASATNGTIRNMWFSGPDAHCILNLANGLTVERNEFMGCGMNALNTTGDNLVFENNGLKHIGGDAVGGVGSGAWIERNDFSLVQNDAVDWMGDDLGVVNNRFMLINSKWLLLVGNDSEVKRNRAEVTSGSTVNGTNLMFDRNRVQYHHSDGLFWSCEAPCTAGGWVTNSRFGVTDGDEGGVELSGGVNGVRVERNQTKNTHDEGFITQSDTFNIDFLNNRVKLAGGDDDEPCFEIRGDNHAFERNRAEECHGEGFKFLGAGITSSRDDARWTEESGFFLNGVFGITVDGARQRDAFGAAFQVENGAVNAAVTNSRTSGSNGQEACDEGTNTNFTGTDVEIDAVCRDL